MLLNDPRSSGGIATEIGLVLERGYQAQIIESPQVAQRAADNLANGTTASEVQDATTVTPAADLNAVTVSGTMPTGAGSAAVVDAVVVAYEEIVMEQVQSSADGSIATLEASVAETEVRLAELDELTAENPNNSALEAQRIAAINQLVALDTRIELLRTNVALYGSGVQLYVAPDTPSAPIRPNPKRNAAAAFVFGALAAGAWASWRAEQNQVGDNRVVAR